MQVRNTSAALTLYVSLSTVGDEPTGSIQLKPGEAKTYNTQVGVLQMEVREDPQGTSSWSGIVPSQALMIGYDKKPYVTVGGQIIPNVASASHDGFRLWPLIVALILLVCLICGVVYYHAR